jgi:hypothetical protein
MLTTHGGQVVGMNELIERPAVDRPIVIAEVVRGARKSGGRNSINCWVVWQIEQFDEATTTTLTFHQHARIACPFDAPLDPCVCFHRPTAHSFQDSTPALDDLVHIISVFHVIRYDYSIFLVD